MDDFKKFVFSSFFMLIHPDFETQYSLDFLSVYPYTKNILFGYSKYANYCFDLIGIVGNLKGLEKLCEDIVYKEAVKSMQKDAYENSCKNKSIAHVGDKTLIPECIKCKSNTFVIKKGLLNNIQRYFCTNHKKFIK